MIPLYQIEAAAFPLAFAFMALVAVNGRRAVWMTLACAGIVNCVFNAKLLQGMDGAMNALVLATLEFSTILALRAFCHGSPLAVRQIWLLTAAWWAHFALYIDLRADTYLIYDWYEYAILAVGIAQIALGFDELRRIARAVAGGSRPIRRVRAAGGSNRVHSGRWGSSDV